MTRQRTAAYVYKRSRIGRSWSVPQLEQEGREESRAQHARAMLTFLPALFLIMCLVCRWDADTIIFASRVSASGPVSFAVLAARDKERGGEDEGARLELTPLALLLLLSPRPRSIPQMPALLPSNRSLPPPQPLDPSAVPQGVSRSPLPCCSLRIPPLTILFASPLAVLPPTPRLQAFCRPPSASSSAATCTSEEADFPTGNDGGGRVGRADGGRV